jgi:predicted RNase H-like nuclease/ppGpp synthetase/RelA/SpoT-type nucleotidyltranferase
VDGRGTPRTWFVAGSNGQPGAPSRYSAEPAARPVEAPDAHMRQADRVFHIGVDLAWGMKRPTGVAVLDAAGRLLHVSTVRTDEEILATLAPYAEDDCLVAIDAPLIVTNPTGNRPAEAALNRDFARFDAGAHPANTGKPEFRDVPRGAGLAQALGLDLNPRSGRRRRAIEVYPHPALVALFRLGRTLKYKNKPGRDLEGLRLELLTLMDLLEGLAGAEPPLHLAAEDGSGSAWTALRELVETATRKSQLRVVEDQVDAVVCAYLALFTATRPAETTTYGDFETGYIVTPTLPADHAPSPRPPKPPAAVSDPVREYTLGHPDRVAAGEQFLALVTSILDDAGINYLSVTGRTKTVASFAEKARRTRDGVPLYTEPLREITDTIGLRVITYVHSDVSAVADLLRDQVVVKDDRDMGRETAQEGRFGYASRHLLIGLDAAREGHPAYALMRGHTAQVQIRTVLQHAWAEFEHDIRYKGTMPDEHARDFDRRFTLAAGLLELADREFSTIRDTLRASAASATETDGAADNDPRIDPRELAAFLAGQYAESGWSRTDHYAWISGLLLELGITSLDELGEVLRGGDEELIRTRMDYRYPPGAVRRLDDALLAAYGMAYVDIHGNSDRRSALEARLERLSGSQEQ